MVYFDYISLATGLGAGIALYPIFLFVRRYRSGQAELSSRQVLVRLREEAEREHSEARASLENELTNRRLETEFEVKKAQVDIERLHTSVTEKTKVMQEREIELHSRQDRLNEREREVSTKIDRLDSEQQKLKSLYAELVKKLESVANLSQDAARTMLREALENEVRLDRQQWVANVEDEAKLTAKDRAIDIVTTSMQRYLADMVTAHSSGVVQLPNEEMKGRIIGKEGRNIKALESQPEWSLSSVMRQSR